MDPLTVLIAIIAGTSVASAQSYEQSHTRDRLHRMLGIYGLEKVPWPSIDNRLRWITQSYGPEIGWLCHQATLLSGEPWYSHRIWHPIGPLLPWLAWRWSKDDAQELRKVLQEKRLGPGFLTSYEVRIPSKQYEADEAYSDLVRLTDWLQRAKPDLFQLTWQQAKNAELAWHSKRLPRTHTLGKYSRPPHNIPTGELVFSFNTDDSEEHPWILTKIKGSREINSTLDKAITSRAGYSPNPDFSHRVTEIYVLWDEEAESVAFITFDQHNNLIGLTGWGGESVFEWDKDLGDADDGEEIIDHLKIVVPFIQPDITKWHARSAPLLAFLDLDDDEAIDLIRRFPSLLNPDKDLASILTLQGYEWYGPKFMQAWADTINGDHKERDYTYTDIDLAQLQQPTQAVAQWIEADQLDNELDIELAVEPASLEDLPPLLKVYRPWHEVESENPEAPVWEIRIHDFLQHPDGPQMEIIIQILVVYPSSPSISVYDRGWVALDAHHARYRAHPDDPWQETYEFKDFEPAKVRQRDPITGEWHFNPALTSDPIGWVVLRKSWEYDQSNTSLDSTLQDAWKFLYDDLDWQFPTDDWQNYFPTGWDLLEPPENIEVTDLTVWEKLGE
jgi:hypothetical protein